MKMKKYLYTAFIAMTAIALSSCEDNEGTTAGSDSKAVVTVYQYAPDAPYNIDEDVTLRFVVNNKVKEYYYFQELSTAKADYIAKNGKAAYDNYVREKGVKVTENLNGEATLTGMAGVYTITVVAVSTGGAQNATETVFHGLTWKSIVKGTITFGFFAQAGLTPETGKTELQVCTTDPYLYRLKDVYGAGSHLKIAAMQDHKQKPDKDGNIFIFCRIPNQRTPFAHPKYGAISVRDIGYWQNDESFITTGGMESGLCLDGPDKNSIYLLPAYYVAAGTLSYEAYDEFAPDAQ